MLHVEQLYKWLNKARSQRVRENTSISHDGEKGVQQIGKNTGKIGELGEDIAVKYLTERGLIVIGRNYRKKWGEIDVIAKQGRTLHFVEVKAVSRENRGGGQREGGEKLSRGTGEYRPEDNVHPKKLERLHRAIKSYLAEQRKEDAEWQLDVLAVELDSKAKTARCRFLENVI